MAQFRLDLSKIRLPGAVKAALKPVAAVDRVLTNAERSLHRAGDKAVHPIASRQVGGCRIPCTAEITGVADLPALHYEQYRYVDVALLRLRVRRPDGEVECCVRQHVPAAARRALAPGATVMALAHDRDRAVAIVDWAATADRLGVRLAVLDEPGQFAWPDRDDWPAERAIEVRDRARHAQRLAERRRDWAAVTARLRDASTRDKLSDLRQEWTLSLELPDGSVASVTERMPSLATARFCDHRPGSPRLGGLASTVELVVRAGAPIEVLREPGGSGLAVDWQATLRHPAPA
jgi:hypothetical protein